MLSIATLKNEKLLAIKSKNKMKSGLVSVLLGDLQLKQIAGEEFDEPVIIDLLNKSIKRNDSNVKACISGGRPDDAEQYRSENDVYRELLTLSSLTDITAEDVLEVVNQLGATSMQDMGAVMGQLKAKYSGRYNPSEASAIVRKALS